MDCWQIDAGSVRLAGRAWPDSFAKLMGLVAVGLGLSGERLGAELYKLLVYRSGGFFAAHRADCELHAAVLRIEEYGSPEFEPVFGRWGSEAYETHLPLQPKGIITLLALAAGSPATARSPAWRDVLRKALGRALSSLAAALQAGSETDTDREEGLAMGAKGALRGPGRESPSGWTDGPRGGPRPLRACIAPRPPPRGIRGQGPQSVYVADVARDLGHRLYSLSDRKKRAPEALQYNSLVGSWSEIRRLARAEVHPRATGAVRAPRWGEGSVSVEIRNLEG